MDTGAQGTEPGAVAVATVQVTAKVKAVDQRNRTVRLEGAKDKRMTYKGGEAQRIHRRRTDGCGADGPPTRLPAQCHAFYPPLGLRSIDIKTRNEQRTNRMGLHLVPGS
jgi:hypothetical protein